MWLKEAVRSLRFTHHLRLKKGKGVWGLLGGVHKLWGSEGRKYMVQKYYLTRQVRVFRAVKVVSGSSSLPGMDIHLPMENSFINANFLYKKRKFIFYF